MHGPLVFREKVTADAFFNTTHEPFRGTIRTARSEGWRDSVREKDTLEQREQEQRSHRGNLAEELPRDYEARSAFISIFGLIVARINLPEHGKNFQSTTSRGVDPNSRLFRAGCANGGSETKFQGGRVPDLMVRLKIIGLSGKWYYCNHDSKIFPFGAEMIRGNERKRVAPDR